MFAVRTPSEFAVRALRWDDEGRVVVLEAEGAAQSASCPACGTVSARVHARYTRRPFDLPWRGSAVRLNLTVRRFACPNLNCRRLTFAEDFGARLPPHAQRTASAQDTLLAFARTIGGEAGARLAGAVGLPVSPDTLLRIVAQRVDADAATPRVLGVDDLALRRGLNYATLLVDMEKHRVVDLLKGRDAETLARWLKARPGVEIVTRDRSEAYTPCGAQARRAFGWAPRRPGKLRIAST